MSSHYSLPYRMTRHFSNESTMIAYTEKIYLRYVNGKREELKLQPDYPVLVISLVKGQEVFWSFLTKQYSLFGFG